VDTLSGKLKLHCPALFSTLSLWERDILDASCFLQNYTSKYEVSYDVDKDFTGPTIVGSVISPGVLLRLYIEEA
jgi:hypothetical protein